APGHMTWSQGAVMIARLQAASVAEQQRRHLAQAAPPRLELVRGVLGDIKHAVDSSLLQLLGGSTRIPAARVGQFAAAIADKNQLDLVGEARRLRHIILGDGAAAEQPDM